ncbi:hypothetical protein HS088_TW13G01337 [Tripterygium wilfordii]|uniref:Autophagy-related protein 27 n=1 Tax=Tripterygium wilfordii TaxID=458696 RepID=A0A7J7CWQ1_TRIWF|nr:uncharacterized protein LOC120013264 [Tripterygium wilfordii]KAF5738438.1 hypothetical protein HS088_TW13G01337 [Tripterygium wilfordii]
MMVEGEHRHLSLLLTILFIPILLRVASPNSVSAVCDFSFTDGQKLYNYSLASPIPNFPHGVLSEDGFYKVAVNDTVLWFQLCNGMIFSHDLPSCVDCSDCGGPSHCGMECSALVSNDIGGYPVCTTVGHASSVVIDIIDKQNPDRGVTVTMSSYRLKHNCSLSVSVICDSNGVQGPLSFDKLGTCGYTTSLRHPAGCATVVSVHGKGWGWFGTLMIIILCLFGAYLLAGMVYRFFALGVRGIDVLPNLEFWARIPWGIQGFFASLVRKFRGPSHGYRSSYSPVNF